MFFKGHFMGVADCPFIGNWEQGDFDWKILVNTVLYA